MIGALGMGRRRGGEKRGAKRRQEKSTHSGFLR
jgi:hypothetical protein